MPTFMSVPYNVAPVLGRDAVADVPTSNELVILGQIPRQCRSAWPKLDYLFVTDH